MRLSRSGSFNKWLNIITAVVLVILLLSVPSSAATTISIDKTIDTPDRTITYQSQNHEIKDIGAYILGEPVNISINVTDINSFQISLLDKDKNFLWNHMVYYTEGKAEVTMPDNVVTTPGTYAFAVFYQGEAKAIKPVVFSRYEMSVIPAKTIVAPGGILRVKVEVEPDTNLSVKVVLARNSSSIESAVNRTREGEYETGINIPASAYGRYSLYAAIASGNMILGYPELIGISGGSTINITEIPTLAANPTSVNSSTPVTTLTPVYPVPLIIAFIILGFIIIVFKKLRS